MTSLASDSGYQSFLRILDSRRTMVEADRQRKIAALVAARDLKFSELLNRETRDLENVDDTFEGRGLYRSGGRLEDRADVTQMVNEDRARTEFELATQTSDTTALATNQLAGLSQQRVSEENAARGRISQRELAMAAQAQSERLAQEERSRWEAEQKRLQALYDAQAAAANRTSTGGATTTVRQSTPVQTRTPTRTVRRTVKQTPRRTSRSRSTYV